MANLWKSVKKAASKAAPVISPLAPLTPITTTYKVTKASTDQTSNVVKALPVSSTVKNILDPVATVKRKTPDLSLSSTSAGQAAAAAAKAKAEAEKKQKELEEAKAAAAAAAESRNEGLRLSSASAGHAASMASINKAKAEAEKAREMETPEQKNGFDMDVFIKWMQEYIENRGGVYPEDEYQIKRAGDAASEAAQMQIYLPEQEVKSDYTKYLLIGGAVVLAVWLFKKK